MAVDILPAAESWPGNNTNNFTGVAMTKKSKSRHKSIEERSWGSIEAHDRAQMMLLPMMFPMILIVTVMYL